MHNNCKIYFLKSYFFTMHNMLTLHMFLCQMEIFTQPNCINALHFKILNHF